jgi:hypothetical protein
MSKNQSKSRFFTFVHKKFTMNNAFNFENGVAKSGKIWYNKSVIRRDIAK